ncbi:nicotinate-nucleotide--dimethylbenzimidazole phosphoribosyltransferase [Streptomyces sp. NPDC044984]|uniref:nicotinate-nucleotide--dimethylbenzimidazole phosphoribosyltransferase n=1 Tax=Streptomyces sp. NPDC044984 TaxID=3154335 RepID=UPI0033F8ADAE
MTDTGQVPGEGLPENAGMVEQPGVPAPDAYAYLSDSPAEDEDLLLPGAQSAWGNEIAPPAPEPVVETVHQPGPHEMAGRDSGSVDLGGVRLPEPPQQAPRRPLHLGPPIPDVNAGPVRSLADRGPADVPVRQAGPPSLGPEYLDVPHAREAAVPQAAAPWGAQPTVGAGAVAGETVVPVPEPMDAAQAVVARVTTEAGAVRQDTPGTAVAVAAQDTEGVAVAGAGEAEAGETGPGAAAGGVEAAAGVSAGGGEPGPVPGPDHGLPGTSAAGPAQAAEAPRTAEAAQAPAPGLTPSAEPAAPEHAQEPEASPAAEAPSAEPAAPQHALAAEAPQTEQAPVAVPAAPAVVPDPAQAAEAPRAAVSEDVPGTDASHGAQVPGLGPAAPQADEAAGAEAAVPAQPRAAEAPQDAQAPGAVADAPDQVQEAEVPQAGSPGPEAVAPEFAQEAEAARAVQVPGAAVAQATEAAEFSGTGGVPGAEPAPPQTTEAIGAGAVEGPEAAQAVPVPGAEALAPEHVPTSEASPDVPAPGADTAVLPGTPAAEADGTAAEAAAPASGTPGDEALPETPTSEVPAAVGPGTPTSEVPAAVGPETPTSEVPAAVGPETLTSEVPAAVGPETPRAADEAADAVPVPGTGTGAAGSGAAPVQGPQQTSATPLTGAVPPEPEPGRPVGEPVPVDGTVPAAPHLAPTPPQGVAVPTGEPREADAEPAQSPEDLDTQGAGVDTETARPTGPAAPGYDDAEREAVLKVMRERRDIRNGFRSDPIPHEVLLRVLEAAHTAPSVGHSQPWDFVVIRSAETRRSMHELAVRQRDAYAKSLPKGRAKQFKELKIEAILDTPVNIVVTADPTRGGRHTLGRHTQPQMAPYSSALAVENLWLAARAEGLGVGWVSFFDEREMVRALGLPEHLEVVAYLCVGYVDEFPDEPELMQAGWSKRRPLSWVVHEETYGRRALPGEDPHDLLAETVAQIRPLDAKALGEAWERQKRMTKPAGALGMLEIISAQLSGLSRQCPPPIPEPAAVAIFAGDHGVHAQGVTPWPQEVTAQMVANFLGGGAVCNAFATQVGAEVCVVDVGVSSDLPATPGLLPRKIRAGTSDMTTGPAMTREEAKKAIEVGIETARDLVAAGNKALLTGEMGIANTTASAALISVFTGADPAEVTGRGTGINDETLARKTEVVRRALELHQPDPADPVGVLAAVGGFEHAAMVGLLLGGASLRTPVILDGVSAGAAALVARAIAPEVLAACIAGHRSAEPGHVAALNKLGLRPLVDLDLRLGEGTGALLALPLVQSTARAMHEVATFDSAGVTEK